MLRDLTLEWVNEKIWVGKYVQFRINSAKLVIWSLKELLNQKGQQFTHCLAASTEADSLFYLRIQSVDKRKLHANQSVNLLLSQPVSQPANQQTNQSTSQLIRRSIAKCFKTVSTILIDWVICCMFRQITNVCFAYLLAKWQSNITEFIAIIKLPKATIGSRILLLKSVFLDVKCCLWCGVVKPSSKFIAN